MMKAKREKIILCAVADPCCRWSCAVDITVAGVLSDLNYQVHYLKFKIVNLETYVGK
jgi:hypothetical protein